MKLWAIGYDEIKNNNVQYIIYKFYPISTKQETILIDKIFNLFYLTHRDAKKEIEEIENNKSELPYKKLYALIFPNEDTSAKTETEYFVELLNFFNLEFNEDSENADLDDIIIHE